MGVERGGLDLTKLVDGGVVVGEGEDLAKRTFRPPTALAPEEATESYESCVLNSDEVGEGVARRNVLRKSVI